MILCGSERSGEPAESHGVIGAEPLLSFSVAKKHRAKFRIIQITCPDEILKERVEKRFRDGKGVGYRAHLKIKQAYEPLETMHEVVDTSKNVEKQLKKILAKK